MADVEFKGYRVFQRSDREDGSWWLCIEVRENGKRKKVTRKLSSKTKSLAEREGRRVFDDSKAAGMVVNDGKARVYDIPGYVRQTTARLVGSGVIEKSTKSNYDGMCRLIDKYADDLSILKVDSHDMDAMVERMRLDGISVNRRRDCVNLIRRCLSVAANEGVLEFNPLYQYKAERKPRAKPVDYLDKDAIQKLLRVCNEHKTSRWSVAAIILLDQGLRCGEVCALRWDDIDFGKDSMTIRRSIGVEHHRTYVKEPKTENGVRTVYMTRHVRETLLMWHDVNSKESDYILGHRPKSLDDGGYYRPDALQARIGAIAREHQIKTVHGRFVTPHLLRHTYGTYAVAESHMDLKTISKSMGHSRVGITVDIYAGVIEDNKRDLSRQMESIFLPEYAIKQRVLCKWNQFMMEHDMPENVIVPNIPYTEEPPDMTVDDFYVDDVPNLNTDLFLADPSKIPMWKEWLAGANDGPLGDGWVTHGNPQ